MKIHMVWTVIEIIGSVGIASGYLGDVINELAAILGRQC